MHPWPTCRGFKKEALRYYRRALDADPQNVRAHWYRGRIYEKEDMDLEAAEDFYLQAAKW